MFRDSVAFNQDISGWDTSAVTDLRDTFRGATAFNQDLGASAADWDTSSVTLMGFVLFGATAFDSDLSAWDVSACGQIASMFERARAVNTSIAARYARGE